MNRERYTVGIAMVIACGLAIGLMSMVAPAGSATPLINKNNEGVDQNDTVSVPTSKADYDVAIMLNAPRSIDKLPDRIEPESLSQNGLVEQSSRFIGAQSGVKYWLALDNAGLVCLIAATDAIAASGCFTGDRFSQGGANVRFSAEGITVEAYAVTDETAGAQSLKSAPVSKVGSNVFVVNASLSSEIRSQYGVSSPLRLFPEPLGLGR